MGTVPLGVVGHSSGSAGSRYPMQVTVSSVGPYRLSTVLAGAAACHRRALVRVSGSPPKRLLRRVGMLSGCKVPRRSAKEMSEGTDHQWVSRAAFTKATGDSS